jgi:hypothetical protein
MVAALAFLLLVLIPSVTWGQPEQAQPPTTPPPPTTEQAPPPTTPPSSATDFNLREFNPRTPPPPQTIPSRPEITFPVTPPGKRPVHLFWFGDTVATVTFERGYAETFTGGQNQGVVLTTGGTLHRISLIHPMVSGRASVAYHYNQFTGIGEVPGTASTESA